MDIFQSHGLKRIINARGKFTPLGVSRSSNHVAEMSAAALKHFFDMDELHDHANTVIAAHCGAQSATIVNCASAGITLSIAATMAGTNSNKIAQLPNTQALKNQVVIANGHLVNYGHSIKQDIRLTGATPIICGTNDNCSLDELEDGLDNPQVTALLYVESRLTRGRSPELSDAITAAHNKGIPVILDGAAQDMRMQELVESGADLITFSAQKYLAAPTAGIVVGNQQLVQAVRAQEKGIGRAMKTSKEAIFGTLAAIKERANQDMQQWAAQKQEETKAFAAALAKIPHCIARLEKDPSKGQFWRVNLSVKDLPGFKNAEHLAQYLRAHKQPIHCNEVRACEGILNFELLELTSEERMVIINRIAAFIDQAKNTRS